MRIMLPLLSLGFALSLGACEYYECGPDCGPCDDPWGDCGDKDPWDDDKPRDDEADADVDADTDSDTDSEDPPAADIQFSLTPDEAEQGDVFIGSLSMSGEDSPGYAAITDLDLYGDVTLLAADVRSYEVLISVAVDADGEGAADLLVEFDNGDAAWGTAVLEIWPDGSGQEAGDAGEGDPCE